MRLACKLRPYQREGIGWLAFLRRTGLHGCLADDMGLGKTLQATAIIAGQPCLRPCKSTSDCCQLYAWIWLPTLCQTGCLQRMLATIVMSQVTPSSSSSHALQWSCSACLYVTYMYAWLYVQLELRGCQPGRNPAQLSAATLTDCKAHTARSAIPASFESICSCGCAEMPCIA